MSGEIVLWMIMSRDDVYRLARANLGDFLKDRLGVAR